MKHIILILMLLSGIRLSGQQEIRPLFEPITFKGYYYKDLDGVLNPYVGLWKGTWEGKTLYIKLKKVKQRVVTPKDNFFDQDDIIGERKIIDSHGNTEVDNITNFDNVYPELNGFFISRLPNIAPYKITFNPKNMCGKSANLYINFLDSAKTQLSMKFIYNPSWLDKDCQYYNIIKEGGDFPVNFPKDIVMTKQ